MSAVRSNQSRSLNRSRHSLPYARPASKKSLWSITGLLSFLNPLRSRSPVDDTSHQSDDVEFSDPPSDEPFTDILPAKEHHLTPDSTVHDLQYPAPANPPHTPVTPTRAESYNHIRESSSPAKNLEAVATFLNQRRGRPISEMEVEGLVSFIQRSTPPEKPERFRFSSSIPSTPARGNSPFSSQSSPVNVNFGFSTPSPNTNQSPASTPRKTLVKNPNGVYRWEGGGSAKQHRTRNRYQSPAFGPPRSTPERIILKALPDEGEVKSDTKRRRVGEDAASSSSAPSGGVNESRVGPQYRASAPEPSPTRSAQVFPFPAPNVSPQTPAPTVNGTSASPKLNGISSSTSRFLTTGIPKKPTTPTVPSPLRQAWGQSSPPDASTSTQNGEVQSSQHRQTKAANFMTELIKEVTPPKRPDVSNPYQTASPVGKVGVSKGRGKRVRATGKPAPPKGSNDGDIKEGKDREKQNHQKAKKGSEKEYSPRAIIEATLPKGSKRSRPSAHVDNSTSATAPASASLSDSTSVPSRSPRDGLRELPVDDDVRGRSRSSQVNIDNVNDGELQPVSKRAKLSVNGNAFTTGQANGRSNASTTTKAVGLFDLAPAAGAEHHLDASITSNPALQSTGVDQPAKIILPSIQTNKASIGTNGSVFGSSPVSGGISPSTSTGRSPFGTLKPSSIPKEPSKLRFSYQPDATSSSPTPTPASHEAKIDAGKDAESKTTEVEELKRKRVDPKDAALAMAVDSLPVYVFTLTGVSESLSPEHLAARNKAMALPKSSLPSFDFRSEKNVKAPLLKESEPALPAAPPVKAFDWAAAGMKPSTNAGGGTGWTCSTCMLSNPASAVDKCTVCDSPR